MAYITAYNMGMAMHAPPPGYMHAPPPAYMHATPPAYNMGYHAPPLGAPGYNMGAYNPGMAPSGYMHAAAGGGGGPAPHALLTKKQPDAKYPSNLYKLGMPKARPLLYRGAFHVPPAPALPLACDYY